MAFTLFDPATFLPGESGVDFLSTVLEASTEYAIVATSGSREIRLWNEGARRLYGYDAGEVIGRKSSILHVPEDIASGRDRDIGAAALRDGRWEGVIDCVRKDGRQISARVVVTPRRNPAGESIGLLLIAKGVSCALPFDGEVRHAHRLSAVLHLCHKFTSRLDPVAILDEICESVREITFARHAVVALVDEHGTRVEHLVTSGKPLDGWQFTFPDPLLDPILKGRTPLRLGGTRTYLGVPILSASRVHGWIGLENVAGSKGFDLDDERLAAMVGEHAGVAYENARLVAELRRQSSILKANDERTRYALAAARIGVWELEVDSGHIVFSGATDSVFDAGGQPPASMRALLDIVHPQDRHALERAIQQTVRTGRELVAEFRLAHAGPVRCVYCRAQRLQEAGRPTRLLGVAMDVSERKSLEEQLVQAQKMEAVGQLAGGVAHDFNNLLTAILGYANMVVDTLDESDERRESIGEVIRSGERAATLTRQLLTFSRREIVQPVPVGLNVLVSGMYEMLRRLIGENIDVVTHLDPAARTIRADPGQIEQVLMNLAVNARDAMPEGGRLEVITANVDIDESSTIAHMTLSPGAYVMLAVRDTGVGMVENTKRRVFEPFFTTKEPGKGTGLGLATVYGIVKQSGGAISVESEPGAGTMFRVYFPAADAGAGDPAAQSLTGQRRSTGSETVLVVEDEAPVRFLTCVILEKAGYVVLEAANPAEAETLFHQRHERVDLLVTDVMMPGASGPALFERLVRYRPELKVLYVSGYTDDTIGHHGLLRPGLHFLEKPFSAGALSRKVREALDTATPPLVA